MSARAARVVGRARIARLGFALALAASTEARANGRYPAAGQVLFDPSDDARVYVRATYGLAATADRGKSFRWICESSIGFSGIEDPQIAALDDGTLVVGISEGISTSHDRGCSFAFVRGDAGGARVVDVARSASDPSRVVALAVLASPKRFVVLESTDGGDSFAQLGATLPSELSFGATLDLAASDPSRVYVSGSARLGDASADGVVVRSVDRGATWTTTPLGVGLDVPYLAAVDPRDADVVFLRVDADVADSLRVSRDGARTFAEVFTSTSDLLGFALSGDGARVAFGGPTDGVYVADVVDGAVNAPTAPSNRLGARCLAWRGDELYACADEAADGFSAGRSVDLGVTFSAFYHQATLELSSCGASTTTGARCPAEWGALAPRLGIDAGADASVDASGGDDASLDVSRETGDDGAAEPPGRPSDDGSSPSGCTASATTHRFSSNITSIYALVALTGASRRRRNRRRGP